MPGVLFDLDQTLVDSKVALELRTQRRWNSVYALIPRFTVYEGIVPLLSMLSGRGIPVGVVTSSQSVYCGKVLSHHQIHFEYRVCYHCTTRRKPYPDPILKGVQLLQIPAHEIWAIGDDPKDVVAAKAAGVHAVAVAWDTTDIGALIASGPEHLFRTVAELHKFLDDLTKPNGDIQEVDPVDV